MPNNTTKSLFNSSSILSIKDIVFPAVYIILLFVLGYFIWKLVSPFIALALGGLIVYIHLLRDIISGKK